MTFDIHIGCFEQGEGGFLAFPVHAFACEYPMSSSDGAPIPFLYPSFPFVSMSPCGPRPECLEDFMVYSTKDFFAYCEAIVHRPASNYGIEQPD